MERRLLRGIMNPAMVLVWIFGLLLAWQGDWWHAGWWQVKFSLVVGLTLDPPPLRPLAQGIRGRPKHPACPLLSLVERGADPADDRYRVPCRPEAVLAPHGVTLQAPPQSTLLATVLPLVSVFLATLQTIAQP